MWTQRLTRFTSFQMSFQPSSKLHRGITVGIKLHALSSFILVYNLEANIKTAQVRNLYSELEKEEERRHVISHQLLNHNKIFVRLYYCTYDYSDVSEFT